MIESTSVAMSVVSGRESSRTPKNTDEYKEIKLGHCVAKPDYNVLLLKEDPRKHPIRL